MPLRIPMGPRSVERSAELRGIRKVWRTLACGIVCLLRFAQRQEGFWGGDPRARFEELSPSRRD